MGVFDDLLVDDAMAFADSDLGDSLTYVSAKAGSIPFSAVVLRKPPTSVPGTREPVAACIELFVPAGIGVTSIDTLGDRVIVAERVGAAPSSRMIASILTADAGGWNLRLR